jgi:hypothetical protein
VDAALGFDSASLLRAKRKASHLLKGRENGWGEVVTIVQRGKGKQGRDQCGADRCGSGMEPVGEVAALSGTTKRMVLGLALWFGREAGGKKVSDPVAPLRRTEAGCSPEDRGVVVAPAAGRTGTVMMFDEEEECHYNEENGGVGVELCGGKLQAVAMTPCSCGETKRAEGGMGVKGKSGGCSCAHARCADGEQCSGVSERSSGGRSQ